MTNKQQPKESKEALDAWEKRTSEWQHMATHGDAAPPGSIDPKQIKFEVGPPMTLEQFQEWKAKIEATRKNFGQN